MDIKQMKNFVSQELKGLKQEHRLLSLRMFQLEARVRGGLQGSLYFLCDLPGSMKLFQNKKFI